MITNIGSTTEYEALLDDAYIKIGGETEKFVPNINFNKWDDEVWFNINHADTIIAAQKETFVDGVVHIVINGIEHKYYVDENNKLEYEIILKERPVEDYIKLKVDYSDNLDFYYQDTLENDWNNMSGLQKLHPKLEDFLSAGSRDENIIGGYVGYIKLKKNGKYKTGRFFSIDRYTLIDSVGNNTSGPLYLDEVNKEIVINMDSAWLDNASYPVVLGPTIGYSTAGSSNYGSNTTKVGTLFTSPASAGNTTFYHIAINAAGSSTGLKQSIYNTSGGSVANQSLLEQITTTASVTDDLQTAGGGAAIAASTLYWIGFIPEDAATKIKYDAVGPTNTEYQTGTTYGAEFVDPFGSVTASIGWIVSIWVDYSGGTVYDMSGTGEIGVEGAAVLNKIGVISATGEIAVEGSAGISSLSFMSGIGEIAVEGAAVLTAFRALLASGEIGVEGSAAIVALIGASATGEIGVHGLAFLGGTFGLSATGEIGIQGEAILNAIKVLIATGELAVQGYGNLTFVTAQAGTLSKILGAADVYAIYGEADKSDVSGEVDY